uniref:Protoheme IX farnesyltransferase, mitochondrial n=2 Tax=Caenorhabditis tropicalis TaxID=1561998 RepID=A0A1I7U570_9PELO
MLSRQMVLCSRLGFTPSTSTAVFHTTTTNSVLPRAKPLDEEMPTSGRSVSKKQRPDTQILDLSGKRHKKDIDIIVADQYLQQWYKMETKSLAADYLALCKSKLSLFVASTATCGFLMAPVPVAAAPLAAATIGTFLLSSAANSCNQLLEAPYDAQMRRTQSRVLVVHRFSPLHAFTFAGVTGLTGIGLLAYYANPLAAALGALNWFIYAVYTPMKRSHIGCTWAGAVVGAIPPLMGYSAATGYLDPAAWCLATILFSWQFPHFNGLSWNLRGDYSKAGYRVMCVTNERLCRVTSIRHSLALLGLCSIAAPLTDLTTLTFAIDSLPVNAYLVYLSYKFYKAPDAKNSRRLFFYSLLHLPLIMLLMGISNYGRNEKQKEPIVERITNGYTSMVESIKSLTA